MIGRNPQKYGGWLLASLLALQVGGPVVSELLPAASRFATLAFYLAILATATATLSKHRRSMAIAIVLSLPVAAVVVASVFEPMLPAYLTERGRVGLLIGASAVPLQVYAGHSTLMFVLRTGLITKYRLMGTGTVFLLFAHAWAGLYAGIELLAPASFSCATSGAITLDELMYFSLVTQTTLGYGDVTPVTTIARSIATVQAVSGLFYMGVIVARLAGHVDLEEVSHADEG